LSINPHFKGGLGAFHVKSQLIFCVSLGNALSNNEVNQHPDWGLHLELGLDRNRHNPEGPEGVPPALPQIKIWGAGTKGHFMAKNVGFK